MISIRNMKELGIRADAGTEISDAPAGVRLAGPRRVLKKGSLVGKEP